MATCEDCLHCDECVIRAMPSAFENTKWEKEPCDHFKDKSIYAKLPCAIGTEVYFIGHPCGGCEAYNEAWCEEFIDRCRNCKKTIVGKGEFDYELIPEFGISVFLSREDAERALKGENGCTQ